ncbi:MAG: hypothetical protein R3E56_05550 [Burkholderiaceae bacterium]
MEEIGVCIEACDRAETEWLAPAYIVEGVRWLARGVVAPDPALTLVVEAAVAPVEKMAAMPEIESPAETASRRALETMYACLEAGHNFRLEAGAGAGKTYSLVKALRFLIERHKDIFQSAVSRLHASPSRTSPRTIAGKD